MKESRLRARQLFVSLQNVPILNDVVKYIWLQVLDLNNFILVANVVISINKSDAGLSHLNT